MAEPIPAPPSTHPDPLGPDPEAKLRRLAEALDRRGVLDQLVAVVECGDVGAGRLLARADTPTARQAIERWSMLARAVGQLDPTALARMVAALGGATDDRCTPSPEPGSDPRGRGRDDGAWELDGRRWLDGRRGPTSPAASEQQRPCDPAALGRPRPVRHLLRTMATPALWRGLATIADVVAALGGAGSPPSAAEEDRG
jgi:hypothetical protein